MTNKNSVCTKKRKPSEKSNDEPGRPPKVVKSTVKRIWIENQTLFEKTITRSYDVFYIKDATTGKWEKNRTLKECKEKVKEYKFKLVDKTELAELRKSKKPILIVKENDKYYYTKIHYKMSFLGSLNVEHKCAPRDGVCKRLTPASDECGGCAKVRDANPHIENYDWITKAYEVVNVKNEAFVVIECEHHELEREPLPSVITSRKKDTDKKKERMISKSKKGDTDLYVESNWNWFPNTYY